MRIALNLPGYREFVARAKKIYPNHPGLHRALEEGRRKPIKIYLRSGVASGGRKVRELLRRLDRTRSDQWQLVVLRKLDSARRAQVRRSELQEAWWEIDRAARRRTKQKKAA